MRPLLHSPMLVLLAVGRVTAQLEYTADNASPATPPVDWTPTPSEEQLRWTINRGRFNSASENASRRTSFTGLAATQGPLAPHYSMTAAARHHAEDMARNDALTHSTLADSPYYNPATQPTPFTRIGAEGYPSPYGTNENATVTYPTQLEAYVGWWNSQPHREAMYSATVRDIGSAVASRRTSSNQYFHVLDMGYARDLHYFTDTVFTDSNSDGLYTQGEGRGGIRINLTVNNSAHSSYDVSTAVGSFVIPIRTIAAGSTVAVYLTNQGASPVNLSIPLTYSTFQSLQLAAGQRVGWGTFTKAAGTANVGFRNLTPGVAEPLVVPQVTISKSGNTVTLSWPSQSGFTYRPQWSENLGTWTNTGGPLLTGTGGMLTATDPVTTGITRRFYKVIITSP